MKLNSIALFAAVSMLNVAPTVVFAQNAGNNTGSATSSSDVGTAPSKGTSGTPAGQAGSEMMPHQQQELGSTISGPETAPSSTDGGSAPATGTQDKSNSMGNGANDGSSKSSSGSSH
ncbi:MAG: hypothetical protein K2X02_01555 [Alphaproteobacteria bacterium]|nr:hypothetical protein [Alphaproteobacteria bacterium]